MDKRIISCAAGAFVAMILQRIIGNIWLPWFIGGIVMSIADDIIWIPKEKRTVPRIVMSMLMTGVAASVAAVLANKFIFPS
ncbi:MAG: hypothetical protein CVT49_10385 [candidate division Zixibacteria bacterium HGW-Zixibacteria-1]|nr:MAG: hypothetical protein CVT49_10385 [candidate division Zixibacteria bacterium HGW-Zixibacteria-1]